jgi:hypothetical protein
MAMAAAAALTALIVGWPFGQSTVSNEPTVDPVVIDPSTVPGEVPQIADTNTPDSDPGIQVGQMPREPAGEGGFIGDFAQEPQPADSGGM